MGALKDFALVTLKKARSIIAFYGYSFGANALRPAICAVIA